MPRPLRIELNGGLCHVASGGGRREDFCVDDAVRVAWLLELGEVCVRLTWVVHWYCLMSNHYHLLVQTPEGNLLAGMRQLNGVYTQRANCRHVAHALCKAGACAPDTLEVPRSAQPPARPLAHFTQLRLPRDQAIARAHAAGDFTMAAVAKAFGVHYSTVSRAVTHAHSGVE